MIREPRWLSLAAVLAIHEELIAEHGGSPELRDQGRLEAALASPRNHFAHGETDVFALADAYAHALTRNHAFVDGNKRVALTVAGVFLELNGHRLEAPEPDAVRSVLDLTTRQMSVEDFAAWLRTSSHPVRKPRRLK